MRLRIIWGLVTVLLLASVVAAAAASTSLSLVPYDLNKPVLDKASGSFSIGYSAKAGETTIMGNVSGLKASTDYVVFLWAPKVGFHHGFQFKTDSKGGAKWNFMMKGDHSQHLPLVVNDVKRSETVLYSR
jgi:hypothetical protein